MSGNIDEIRQLMAEALAKAEYKLAQDVQTMISAFVSEGLDYTLAQNQMLIALSNITGQLIACLPASQRDFVEEQVLKNIPRQRIAADEFFSRKERGEIDLATTETKGRC